MVIDNRTIGIVLALLSFMIGICCIILCYLSYINEIFLVLIPTMTVLIMFIEFKVIDYILRKKVNNYE